MPKMTTPKEESETYHASIVVMSVLHIQPISTIELPGGEAFQFSFCQNKIRHFNTM